MIEATVRFLLETQNLDGGWGAREGKRSNTEATSLALLGLSMVDDPALITPIDRGLGWLVKRQRSDGSWPFTDQLPEGSWTTAFAVISLAAFEAHQRRALRGADWLLRQKVWKPGWRASLQYRQAPHTLPVLLNPDLEGWSWTPNAFSWVEPTAYALIALKKLSPFFQESHIQERIHQGELLIYDRMCKRGGWNYGNSIVLGEELPPYPDTTAVALIALQDHPTVEANRQSLLALRSMLTQVQSGLSLSWSILCFALYGQDVTEWQKLLARTYKRTGFLGETKAIALALLASQNDVIAFRV